MNPVKVFAGIMIIMLGFILLTISQFENVEYGGVVIIGPIPIVFASSQPILMFLVIASFIFILFLVLTLRW